MTEDHLKGFASVDRIHLGLSNTPAKMALGKIWNGWLTVDELKKAKTMSADASTEAECAAYLQELEKSCSSRLATWRAYQ